MAEAVGQLKRRAVVAAGTLALSGVLQVFASSAGAAGAATRPQLPEPTGRYAVGTTVRQFTDPSRKDPWHPERGPRQVAVSFWYPAARGAAHGGTVPQMRRDAAVHFGSADGAGHGNYGVPAGAVDWAATRTHAHRDAPPARGTGPCPVVLYSAGLGDPRTWNTTLVEELASRGYVVVTLDHTYDSSEVALSGGRLATSVLPGYAGRPGTDVGALLRKAVRARVDDTRFVLDRLGDPALRAGLPPRLAGAMDLGHIGMAGQSAGGFTALQTMHDDRRIKAAVNMDGTLAFPGPDGTGSHLSQVAREGVDRPFLLMGTESADSGPYRRQPSWKALWEHSRGWRGDVTLAGSRHGVYTDAASLLPQAAARGEVPRETVREDIGTVRPGRAVAMMRGQVTAFFDRFLRGRGRG
ncbi:alpha/beta hydrolase family protein [Streptomyces sp. NPDC052396]|uniref:alpha/beta hydrolase family protein n=1 Tax=Streptomyces sp. NPDC052396 TaxID=3365689 RepID=UPI0037D7F738